MSTLRKISKTENLNDDYSNFYKINGDHALKEKSPEAYVGYQARKKAGGKVAYFNFELAKEIGLIPQDHENKLNPSLEQHILDTFSIVIINEYDLINKIKFKEEDILPNTYMATKYLQLQHPDKVGKNSGDGRSIWNGSISHKGITWDISSCGTGATRLSPACNNNKKFYQTGDPSISYGCGLSDLDEGIETLFFSEVLHQNNLKTERVLTIIEFPKSIAINVRANPNLLRPSHFLNHLKQGNLSALKNICDYYIEREISNKNLNYKKNSSDKEKYAELARQVALTFSKTAAKFEDDYIFCWLDWDGDNILMDGGIIDYGSIRQFGLFHDEYRFDDVERFSTTIREQRLKARYIAQCFAQIADFLITKKKKTLSTFKNHLNLKLFDKHFTECKMRNLLHKMGLQEEWCNYLYHHHLQLVEQFNKSYVFFERAKTKRKEYRVPDGITKDAIYCMRDILRELPQLLLTMKSKLSHQDFIDIIKSSYASKKDTTLDENLKYHIDNFQDSYLNLVDKISHHFKQKPQQVMLGITMRSSIINKYDRVTGNSISYVVEKVMKKKNQLTSEELFSLVKEFTHYQTLDPDKSKESHHYSKSHQKLMKDFLNLVRENREGL